MYPELRPMRVWSLPCTRPSIAARASGGRPVSSSSAGSSLSVISGTVGRERPAVMGACVRGVFCGVGAVGSNWLIGIEVDMVSV